MPSSTGKEPHLFLVFLPLLRGLNRFAYDRQVLDYIE